MPSFDVVSEADEHEIKNAFDQAEREVRTRYDFQGTDAKLTKKEDSFHLTANGEDRVNAMYEVLQNKMLKRSISLKFLDPQEVKPGGNQMWSQEVLIKKGIDKENAKKIVKIIKEDKSLKVTPAINGDAVRVTGKKRDDLQEVMAMLKTADLPLALTYNNFRD